MSCVTPWQVIPVLLCPHHGAAEVEQARGVPEVLERGTESGTPLTFRPRSPGSPGSPVSPVSPCPGGNVHIRHSSCSPAPSQAGLKAGLGFPWAFPPSPGWDFDVGKGTASPPVPGDRPSSDPKSEWGHNAEHTLPSTDPKASTPGSMGASQALWGKAMAWAGARGSTFPIPIPCGVSPTRTSFPCFPGHPGGPSVPLSPGSPGLPLMPGAPRLPASPWTG